jgi:tetratricopeptide (TPR) repeat protein
VVEESVDNLTRSDEAQLYKYRARIELGQAAAVAAEMQEVGTTGAGFEAVRAFADYRSGKKEKAVEDAEELIQADSDDNTVQVVGATVLYLEGRIDEALDLLSKHENNLEAYIPELLELTIKGGSDYSNSDSTA